MSWRWLGLGWVLASVALGAAPNLVVILADDMGYGDPGYAGGKIATPAIDRLAREGMRFSDAHSSSSVCTPTRYGLLTGRYNWRSKLKESVLWGDSEPLIERSRITIADLLADAGHRTAVVGKWHLGLGWERLPERREATRGRTLGPGWDLDYSRPVAGGPLALGFATDFLFPASLDMPPYVYLRDDEPVAIPVVTKSFKVPKRPGPASEDFEAVEVLRDLAREARAFIRGAGEERFFLYLPLTSPHTPIVPAPRWRGKSGFGEYGDFLMETDWVVGEVLAELDEQGVADQTLVVFTADNGASPRAGIPELIEKGHWVNGFLRGHKADIYEGGHRVPFVARWPARIQAGSECAATICLTDLFATAAELVGARVPPEAGEDSRSLLPLLEGREGYTRETTVHHSINGSFAIREGDWKLCLCPGSGGWSPPKPGEATAGLHPVQLYNLRDDLAEEDNLAELKPERVEALADRLAGEIARGRSTPGPRQDNDGWPETIPARVIEMLPQLQR